MWECEISDKDFKILMLYLNTQKQNGTKVYYNEIAPNNLDKMLVLKSLQNWLDIRESVCDFLEQNAKDEYEKIKSEFKNSDWK